MNAPEVQEITVICRQCEKINTLSFVCANEHELVSCSRCRLLFGKLGEIAGPPAISLAVESQPVKPVLDRPD